MTVNNSGITVRFAREGLPSDCLIKLSRSATDNGSCFQAMICIGRALQDTHPLAVFCMPQFVMHPVIIPKNIYTTLCYS